MSLTSPQFLVLLLPLVVAYQFVVPKWRSYLLLVASLAFIGCFNLLSLISIIALSAVNYFAGKINHQRKSALLYRSMVLFNGLAIILFNSGNSGFGIVNFKGVAFSPGAFLIAVGISFYSLQHIAYQVDVYKRRIVAEGNFLDFLLLSSYFPKVIAGPLMLYQDLKPQFTFARPPMTTLISGFNRIALGFFKKMVLADRLGPSVSSVFDFNDDLPGLTIITSAVLFTLQLYFDFSGYCDIAIGISCLFGISLDENFYFPLRSTSVTVFWRRWHHTLIRFFTNYIFYPITFRLRNYEKPAVMLGIFITFFLSAIWHGVGLTFLLWGLCHIFYLFIELFVNPVPNEKQQLKNNLVKSLYSLYVLVAVSFSHVFFRSTGMVECRHLLGNLFSRNFLPVEWDAGFFAPLAVGGHQAEYFNLSMTLLLIMTVLTFEKKIFHIFNGGRLHVVLTCILLLLIFVFGVFNSGERFIYMQF
jgi:D-alanyl-lipoteichoic acid acyltransferase DltB (MBOAT superfamily)